MDKLLLMDTELTESEQIAFDNAAAWHQLRLALIKRRVELGLSQEDLADQMGITQPAVSQFERLGGNPRIMTILNYAHALGVRMVLGAEPQLEGFENGAKLWALSTRADSDD